MKHAIHSIHSLKYSIVKTAEHFGRRHPLFSLLGIAIGMPLFMTLMTAGFAFVLTVPTAWLLGWI